jgi:FkbM family methyltransferase
MEISLDKVIYMSKYPKRPIAYVLISSDQGTMLVNRFDYHLVGNGGYGVGYSLLNQSSFESQEIDTVLQLLGTRRQSFGDGVVAIDCGANIGIHTVEWARYMYGWGEVIAFEAQERVYYALAGNIALNNCFNATAHLKAVGKEVADIDIPQPDYFKPSSFGSLEIKKSDSNEFIGQKIDYAAEKCRSVPLITIDSLSLERLDLIKIDIEGMEIDALEGAKKSIEKFLPILSIEKIKSDESALKKFLTSKGYKIYFMGINIVAIHESDPANKLIPQ